MGSASRRLSGQSGSHAGRRRPRFKDRRSDSSFLGLRRSRNEIEALEQRTLDRYLEEPLRLGLDNLLAVGREKGSNLPLGLQADRPEGRIADTDQGIVGVLWQSRVFGIGQVMAVKGGAVCQIARAEECCGRRVGDRLVPFAELDDDRLGGYTRERGLA